MTRVVLRARLHEIAKAADPKRRDDALRTLELMGDHASGSARLGLSTRRRIVNDRPVDRR